jgi:hypothetical protein
VLRRNFQILVAVSQILTIGIVVVQYLTESSLPPELLGYLGDYETILIPDRLSIIELLTNIPFLIQTLLGILAATGLILFRTWGRPVYLVYIAAGLVITVLAGPYITTGWTAFIGYISSLTEGLILALLYFSPIRKMFGITEPSAVARDPLGHSTLSN